MSPLTNSKFDRLTNRIIACAREVHQHLGPGLCEASYEQCLVYELRMIGIRFARQRPVLVRYKRIQLNCDYHIDLLIEEKLIVEIKCVEEIFTSHKAQLLSFMKLCEINCGLLINFNVKVLRDGIYRCVL
jgi:GxxExxY protein